MGGRDGDGAQLVQAHHAHPELPAALEGEHYSIALLYPVALKEVGCLVAQSLQILEVDGLLLSMIIAPDKGTFVRTFSSISIDDVISEIEVLGDDYPQILSEVIV
jgi:hypothetical protein